MVYATTPNRAVPAGSTGPVATTTQAVQATVAPAMAAGNAVTGSQMATRAELLDDIATNGVRVTKTVASIWERNIGRFVPPSVVEQAVQDGRQFSDPQGNENVRVFFTTTVRNGVEVGVKVAYDMVNRVVVHLHFDNPDKILRQLENAQKAVKIIE